MTLAGDDATNAVPFTDITTGAAYIKAKCGIPRSHLSFICNENVFRNVMRSAKVRADVKYTVALDTMVVSAQRAFLAQFLQIKEIIVVESFYDSTPEGKADATFTDLWSNEWGLLCYIGKGGNSWKLPGMAARPVYKRYSPDFTIFQYREETTASSVIRIRAFEGEKVNTLFGFLYSNITTI